MLNSTVFEQNGKITNRLSLQLVQNNLHNELQTKVIATMNVELTFVQGCFYIDSPSLKHQKIALNYRVYGLPIGSAPVILVNHALTGNSEVTGPDGWWQNLIGIKKTIDLTKFTVLAFDIPGNGFDQKQEHLISDYKTITTRLVAEWFWEGVNRLKIKQLYAVIGGSLGGAIAWEMVFMHSNRINHLIPIASDWKSTDWMIANVTIQDQLLNQENLPIEHARIHAMTLYRTPMSFKQKFNREFNPQKNMYQVQSWLYHHAEKLNKRFNLSSYRLMNHLLGTIGKDLNELHFETFVKDSTTQFHLVGIDSDGFFPAVGNINTNKHLIKLGRTSNYIEINSINGHDGFLIEYDQLSTKLNHLFNI